MNECKELIREYVASNLSTGLLTPSEAGVYPKYVEINEHMLRDAKYHEMLVNAITEHILEYTEIYFKPELGLELAKKHYLAVVTEIFNVVQLALLAEYYDKQIVNQKVASTAKRK